ncbi:Aspartyl/glutamyl-tRNA(Asn/Gln) amidotransferase subunit C [Thiomonas sp. X19]|uniref:Asp-tRNA(Asn)/Glu-tRNA(Gln) amidotransferase subunit GatC n=1 Tax=Thiomonas sp. X19 TaxID=1050370 RepID=UPI000B74CB30|nr:Asp-tRNA(Asn)/Glu-tRNA(Gln) amidotransferase subunit GatC [Thiomonas sp. X19]SCC91547.1 Aspartyl/glutamyl-tRNA(Asn/Gln) amidotransferase subunit C [Thiomonas sp. X19]
MPLQPSDIDRIATLARLRLSSAEQTSMLAQINDFFAIVERMRAVDTTGVEPLAHPLSAAMELPLRLRDDLPVQPDILATVLANAPAAQDGMFIVPRVLE